MTTYMLHGEELPLNRFQRPFHVCRKTPQGLFIVWIADHDAWVLSRLEPSSAHDAIATVAHCPFCGMTLSTPEQTVAVALVPSDWRELCEAVEHLAANCAQPDHYVSSPAVHRALRTIEEVLDESR